LLNSIISCYFKGKENTREVTAFFSLPGWKMWLAIACAIG